MSISTAQVVVSMYVVMKVLVSTVHYVTLYYLMSGSARITSISFTEGGTPGGLGTFAPISDRPNKGWDTPGVAAFDNK